MNQEAVLDALRVFKKEHAHEYALSNLGIFGSFARGEEKYESDVDIVFTTAEPNLFRTACLKEDLETLLHRPVDIVRFRPTMNPYLKARIERDAIYV